MADHTVNFTETIPASTYTYRTWYKNKKPVVFYTAFNNDPVIFYTESGDTDPVIFYERAEFVKEGIAIPKIEDIYVFAGKEGFSIETYAIPPQTLGYTAALVP